MYEETKVEKYFLHLNMGDVLDQDQLDQLTRQLQNELFDHNVENAGLVSSNEIPEGAKAAGAVAWGAIAIEVLPTFLPGVIEFLKSWVNRDKTRNVKIRTQVGDKTVELEYSSSGIKGDEVKELVSILSASMQVQQAESPEDSKAELAEERKPTVQSKFESKEHTSVEEVGTSPPGEETVQEKSEINPIVQPDVEGPENLAEEEESVE